MNYMIVKYNSYMKARVFFRKKLNQVFIKLLSLNTDNSVWEVAVFNTKLNMNINVKNILNNSWIADPFLFNINGEYFLFVEQFNKRTKRGEISFSKFEVDGFQNFTTCIRENFHLSFPRVFMAGDNIYMTVESSSQKGVRLYRSLLFPISWELEIVVNDFNNYKDPIIIPENEQFYLFVSSKYSDSKYQIELFESKDLYSKNWVSYSKNPISIGISSIRNGGLITGPDRYVLVRQRNRFGIYGYDLEFFEINSPIEFSNFTETSIKNTFFKKPSYAVQFHTINSSGDLITYDYKRKSSYQNTNL